jgi:hypothetical protein
MEQAKEPNKLAFMDIVIVILLVITLFACQEQNSKTTSITRVEQKDSIASKTEKIIDKNIVEQIIFGEYCGECIDSCAIMYCYNIMGNQNSLFVDYTDSYFGKNRKLKFKTPIIDKDKLAIASQIVKKIPKCLQNSEKLTETYGCPDCTDGCGIYFEIKKETGSYKYYIDTDVSVLKGEIKQFAEYLIENIQNLNM